MLDTPAVIGFGANQGDPEQMLDDVRDLLSAHWKVSHVSSLIETKAIGGPPNQPSFHNAALRATTRLDLSAALTDLLSIEQGLGRIRRQRWGPRVVDLDLLLFGDQVHFDERIAVPHPRLLGRNFALRGALEIAAHWIHPFCNQTLDALWRHGQTREPRLLVLVPESLQTMIASWNPLTTAATTTLSALNWESLAKVDWVEGTAWQILATSQLSVAQALAPQTRVTIVLAPLTAAGRGLWQQLLPWPAPLVRILEATTATELQQEVRNVQLGLSG